MYRGRFGIQSGTVHTEGQYRGWSRYQRLNRPRWESISWTVRSPKRTFHAKAPHQGRFDVQSGTCHTEAQNQGRSNVAKGTCRTEAQNQGRFNVAKGTCRAGAYRTRSADTQKFSEDCYICSGAKGIENDDLQRNIRRDAPRCRIDNDNGNGGGGVRQEQRTTGRAGQQYGATVKAWRR